MSAWRVGDAFARVWRSAPAMVYPGLPPDASARREREAWRAIVRQTYLAADSAIRPDDFNACFEELFAFYATGAAWRARAGAHDALAALRAAHVATAVVSNFDRRLRGHPRRPRTRAAARSRLASLGRGGGEARSADLHERTRKARRRSRTRAGSSETTSSAISKVRARPACGRSTLACLLLWPICRRSSSANFRRSNGDDAPDPARVLPGPLRSRRPEPGDRTRHRARAAHRLRGPVLRIQHAGFGRARGGDRQDRRPPPRAGRRRASAGRRAPGLRPQRRGLGRGAPDRRAHGARDLAPTRARAAAPWPRRLGAARSLPRRRAAHRRDRRAQDRAGRGDRPLCAVARSAHRRGDGLVRDAASPGARARQRRHARRGRAPARAPERAGDREIGRSARGRLPGLRRPQRFRGAARSRALARARRRGGAQRAAESRGRALPRRQHDGRARARLAGRAAARSDRPRPRGRLQSQEDLRVRGPDRRTRRRARRDRGRRRHPARPARLAERRRRGHAARSAPC